MWVDHEDQLKIARSAWSEEEGRRYSARLLINKRVSNDQDKQVLDSTSGTSD